MIDAVKNLFAEYGKAFNALEVEKQMPFFAEHFISAGPRGQYRTGEMSPLKRRVRQWGSTGAWADVRKNSFNGRNLNQQEYSMVKVHWRVTFVKTGNKLIEFDVTYFIQKTGPEPKIIMFIAHQDEESAMKELGLSG